MIDFLRAGLKGAGLRQSLIANNIANMHTPGFHRGQVQFETLLTDDAMFEKVLSEALEDHKAPDLEAADALIFTPNTTELNETGNDVSLDMEVGEMVKNVTRYKTYIRLLGRELRNLDLAVRETNM